MAAPSLPPQLTQPLVVSGKVVLKVMQDLTVYPTGPSLGELEYFCDLYERLCPPGRGAKYKIAELEYWPPLARPQLTASGRAAASAGARRPYFEPVRRRIREGRAFEAQLWDGRPIDDLGGSWSLNCRRIHLRASGLHTFARILAPLQTDSDLLRRAALDVADNVELASGHGGPVFAYDPWFKIDAFDTIYARARRFWGVDIEDLNATLPLMRRRVKGVNWITLVGRRFLADPDVARAVEGLTKVRGVAVEQRRHAAVIVAGPAPAAGDQHRPDSGVAAYVEVARALAPLFPTAHPDFGGTRFPEQGNTIGWVRRFIDPAKWR